MVETKKKVRGHNFAWKASYLKLLYAEFDRRKRVICVRINIFIAAKFCFILPSPVTYWNA